MVAPAVGVTWLGAPGPGRCQGRGGRGGLGGAIMMGVLLLLAAAAASAIHQGAENDTTGCLVRESDESDVWVIHAASATSSGRRNWVEGAPEDCVARATLWPPADIDAVPKRYGGQGNYSLSSAADVAAACANSGCCGSHADPRPCPAADAVGCLVTEAHSPRSDAWLYEPSGNGSGQLRFIEHTPLWCLKRAAVWPAKDIAALPTGVSISTNQDDPGAACRAAACCGNHTRPHPCGPPLPPPPPPPTIASVTPRRVAVEGGDSLLVLGARLGNTSRCRLEPASGSTGQQLHALSSFPATVINDSAVRCTGVPPVLVPGPALLTLSTADDDTNFKVEPSFLDSNRVSYFATIDVAVGRRPYIHENSGSLLLALDPSVVDGRPLHVRAELPAGGPKALWSWPALAANATEMVLPLSFGNLPPPPLHNDMVITVTLGGRTTRKLRRFHRVPPPPAGSTVEPVQVDHAAKSLRVSGKLFNPVG